MIHSGRVIFFLLLLSSPSGDAFRIHTKKGRSSQKTVIKVGRELEKDGGRETHSNSGSLKPGELHGPEAHSNSGQILVDISSPRDIVGSKSSTQHSADRVDNASGDRQPITARILSEGNDSSQKNPDHTSETLPLLQLNESVLRQRIPTATSWSLPQDSSVEHGAPNVSRETKMTNSTATKTGQRRQHIPTATSWSRRQDSSVDPEATSTSLLAEVGNATVLRAEVCCKCRKKAIWEYKFCPNKGDLAFGKGTRYMSCTVGNCGFPNSGWDCGVGGRLQHLANEQDCKAHQERKIQRAQPDKKVVNILAISDPGQDLDDEMSYIMMAGLKKEGLIDVVGVVTTMPPEDKRAALARGTLNALGLKKVPVGIGSNGNCKVAKMNPFEDGAGQYCDFRNPRSDPDIESDGQLMLKEIYTKAEPKSITLLIIASFKDVATFMVANLKLFLEKTYEVVIMGGASFPIAEGSLITPDNAHNQIFDPKASETVFRTCQNQKVPLIIISRYAVQAVPFHPNVYTELAGLSLIGERLQSAQKTSIENLWRRALLPAESEERGDLPARCDRTWFVNTFLGGISPANDAEEIFDKVKNFFQYDSMALLAAVPTLRTKLFDPFIVNVYGIEHQVIGIEGAGTRNTKPEGSEGLAELQRRLSRGYVDIARESQPAQKAWIAELAAKRQGHGVSPIIARTE